MTGDGGERARAYAAWARSGSDASFAPVVALLLDLLPAPPLRVLDVGCGEGRVGAELTKRGYVVEGVDVEPALVELAGEHHSVVVADATSLPFPDGSFDAVVSVHALMEVDDLDAALRETARVLGSAVAGDPCLASIRIAIDRSGEYTPADEADDARHP